MGFLYFLFELHSSGKLFLAAAEADMCQSLHSLLISLNGNMSVWKLVTSAPTSVIGFQVE